MFILLLCGCSKINPTNTVTTNYNCRFSCDDTAGDISCTAESVVFSNICVSGEQLNLIVTVKADRYTVATADNSAEYMFASSEAFPLAEFGKVLLKAASTGNIESNTDIGSNGYITKVSVDGGMVYTLNSHSKINQNH